MGHRPGMSNQKAAMATLMCDITPKVLSLQCGKDNDKISTITNPLEPTAYKIPTSEYQNTRRQQEPTSAVQFFFSLHVFYLDGL